ncbi:hypothetical protein D6C81_10702, partial [Aureobasidium pullulans]
THLTDYTAGRWLRNDNGERKARYISFDFKALVDKVVSCCEGATSIQTWLKKEGNFCKAFVFCTDNGKQIVAKLPTPIAGPKSLITNSKVATIRYWVDIPAYCNGLIDIALTRLPPPNRSHPNEKSYQGRVEEYVQLLGIARKILQILARHPRINDNASLTMMHLDLHLHNIFVDPDDATIITAFIDWQGTGIEPAFEHAGMVLDLKTTQLHFPGKRDSEGDSHLVLERAYDALVKVYVPRLG